jgi:Ras-related and estrogen-regulated growth inhibitor-like protein
MLQKNGCLYEHIRWGEAFVIVYSVSDRHSFHEAQEILSQLAKLKLPSYYTSLLLGNKRDLDHSRWVRKRPPVGRHHN